MATGLPDRHCRRDRSRGFFSGGYILDPTRDEIKELLFQDMQRLVNWGFDLIKHDFTTFDLLGWWGSGSAGKSVDRRWLAVCPAFAHQR